MTTEALKGKVEKKKLQQNISSGGDNILCTKYYSIDDPRCCYVCISLAVEARELD